MTVIFLIFQHIAIFPTNLYTSIHNQLQYQILYIQLLWFRTHCSDVREQVFIMNVIFIRFQITISVGVLLYLSSLCRSCLIGGRNP
jgi:hypothetical protein